MEKYKKLQPTEDLYIKFSDEELQELGWEKQQKLSVELTEDGGIVIKPYAKIEIDMEEWPRETLEYLISESCEQDKSINDIISDVLSLYLLKEGSNEN